MSEPQKIFASLSGAVIAHLLFLLLIFLVLNSGSSSSPLKGAQSPKNSAPREVSILMGEVMELIDLEPPTQAARPFIDTDLNTAAADPPKNAQFESDRNTVAASELKPEEILPERPLPTLVGDNPLPQISLQDRNYNDGQLQEPASAASGHSSAESRPSSPNGVELLPAIRDSDLMTKKEIQLESPVAAETTENPPEIGYSPEERQNEINGKTSKKGQNAVDAEETAMGRYKKEVRDAISATWHRYRQENAELVSWGILKLEFSVDASGRVNNLQIIKNEANSILAEFSLKAIRDAELPPMPQDVANSVGAEGLAIQYDIIIY